jgi:peptidyl-prolyl cis-trans isomerase SurA
LIALLLIPSALLAGEPVERIAALVNGEIVFLSDLQRYQLFFEPLEKKEEAARGILKTLDSVVNQRLLRKEARRFVLQGPSEEEINQRSKVIRERFKNEAAFSHALDQTGFSLEAFKEEIRNTLWAEKLIQDRIQSFIFIAPRQVERYYQDHAEEFREKSLKEVEPKIQKILTEEREVLKTREYLARLRERAEIQINLTDSPQLSSPGQSSPVQQAR